MSEVVSVDWGALPSMWGSEGPPECGEACIVSCVSVVVACIGIEEFVDVVSCIASVGSGRIDDLFSG